MWCGLPVSFSTQALLGSRSTCVGAFQLNENGLDFRKTILHRHKTSMLDFRPGCSGAVVTLIWAGHPSGRGCLLKLKLPGAFRMSFASRGGVR